MLYVISIQFVLRKHLKKNTNKLRYEGAGKTASFFVCRNLLELGKGGGFMRKSLAVLTVCALMLGACGAKDQQAAGNVKEEEKVVISKTIKVPNEYVAENGLVEEWDPSIYEKSEVKDSETIFQMSDEQYKELVADSKKNLAAMMKQVSGSKKFEAVNSIEQQSDYERIRINVDKKAYLKSDKESLFQTIGLPLIHYHLLKGVPADSIVIECEIWDDKKEENIDVVILPMDLSNGELK